MLLTNNHKNLILNNCTKQDIINYLNSAWETEDILFKSIQDDRTFYLNPDSLRNPLIFFILVIRRYFTSINCSLLVY